MANGHVEIHDPFSKHNGIGGSRGPKSTSDPDSMEDTVEFRLLMAYAKRRRPEQKETPTQDGPVPVCGPDSNGSSSPQTPHKTEKERKRKGWKKRWRRLSIFSCISPRTRDEEPRDGELCQVNVKQPDVDDRCAAAEEEDDMKEAAERLTKLADEIHFIPPEVETDAVEDVNVERMIGLLLRDAGDRLNEEELKDADIATELFWNYSFFKLLMTTVLTRMGLRTPAPDSPGPKASPKTQIAVTCEVTTRLSAVNPLPRNRLLDHGARYLQHYYSSWAQHQGGYEEAFYSDDEDSIQ